ncbi:mechanosensitive ion channel family protein [Rhizorhabdus phycosphaerae]|uniref:mechanosensitive ion channel family protein n=1 Tax=Rhizorhabdus phycosphaerae TaxID=2711156 RepID=UPI0013ED7C79|nr:mechanosensitive ion channel family protein [Rhizorhabdus phycosphaerae]
MPVTKAAAASGDATLAKSLSDAEIFYDQTMGWIATHYMSIVIACSIGAVIIAVLYGLRMLGTRLCRREHVGHWPKIIGRAISRTNLFFIVTLAARLVSGYAAPPAVISTTIGFLFTVAAALQAALWVRELIIGIVEYRAGDEESGSSTLGSAIGIIRLLVTSICFIVATLLILDNIGVNITGLVASLGIGGIAIGLAAQGIFSDLFASLAIIFDRPFRRGDTVRWDQTVGTVESIGLKTTRVRATTGEEVVISNTNLLNKELRNLAHTMRRRATLMLGVTYQTSPETCRRLPDIVKTIVTAHDKAVFLHCCMTNFGASSLDYELLFDVIDEDVEVFNATRHAICIEILESFAREGIDFAYPTQTTFTAAPDGRMIMPYAEIPPDLIHRS